MGLHSSITATLFSALIVAGNVSAATYYPYTVETWPPLLLQTAPATSSYSPAYPTYSPTYTPYAPSSHYQCLYRNPQGECMIEQYVAPTTRTSAPIYTRSYLEEECDRSNRYDDDDSFYDCEYFEEDDDSYGAIDDDDDFYDEDEDDFFFDDEDEFFDDDDDASNNDDDDDD